MMTTLLSMVGCAKGNKDFLHQERWFMLKGEISLGKEVQSITCLGTTKSSKELDVTEAEGVLNLKSFLLREASRGDKGKGNVLHDGCQA